MLDKIKSIVEQEHCIEEGTLNVVWSCKTLQNYKAIFSKYDAENKKMHLFEATYNGDKNQLYIDHYIKEENTCIDMED